MSSEETLRRVQEVVTGRILWDLPDGRHLVERASDPLIGVRHHVHGWSRKAADGSTAIVGGRSIGEAIKDANSHPRVVCPCGGELDPAEADDAGLYIDDGGSLARSCGPCWLRADLDTPPKGEE